MQRILLIFVVTLIVMTVACKREQALRIGVVPKGANHIFWQTVHAGAIKAGREYGAEIEWNAPTLEVDSSRQIEIVDSMVNKQLSALVLAPVDRKALVAPVERAVAAGMPVAIFDSNIDTDKRVSYVATDNKEGGRMAARRLAEIIGGKGKVAVIGFMAGSASTMEREDGFVEEIRKYPNIRMIGIQFGMADRAKSMAVTENLMTAHSDLAGLFADNESSSSGCVQALKGRNAKQVKLVAFDASEQLIQDMKDGWIDSLVVQNPFKMGYESTKAVLMKLKGQDPVKQIDSGATLVKASDLDKPEMKQLLFPDIQQYLSGSPAEKH
jgi:ribose transport system substrate-binding protein